jgi:hypothetical protein
MNEREENVQSRTKTPLFVETLEKEFPEIHHL